MPARPSPDRPVPLLRLYWRMGGWAALIPLTVALILTVISHVTTGYAARFEAEGVETTGTVIARDISVSRDSDGDESYSYFLTVQFDARNGAEVRARKSTSRQLYEQSPEGTRLTLWYLTTEPDRIELRRGENAMAAGITQGVALLFGIGAIGAFWFPARRAVAAIRARRYGAEERAEVLGRIRTSITVNGARLYRLQWREASGRLGESLAYREEALAGYDTGASITVYQGITRAWWRGDVGPRA